MKITTHMPVGPIVFQPFEIVVTFESLADVQMWTDIMSHNVSIPDLLVSMKNTASSDAGMLCRFMGELNSAALEGNKL